MKAHALASIFAILAVSNLALAAEHWVAPDGKPDGDGTAGKPWELDTALAQPSSVKPGDTIWLRAGTYVGKPYTVHGEVHRHGWISTLAGELGKGVDDPGGKIHVRAEPGKRVTLDGENTNGEGIFAYGGRYTWFWDIEITSSAAAKNRKIATPGSWPVGCHDGNGNPYPDGIRYGEAIQTIQDSQPHTGIKFIDIVVHDARQGFSSWREAQDLEVYGAIVFYNGWSAPDRGHGHGVYSQNWPNTGKKRYRDMVIFQNFDNGIQAYGSDQAYLDAQEFEGNTIFQAGSIDGEGAYLLELGGGNTAHDNVVKDNVIYQGDTLSKCNFGYSSAGTANLQLVGNTIAVQSWPMYVVSPMGETVKDNVVRGVTCCSGSNCPCGWDPQKYPMNTNYLGKDPMTIPTAPDATFVRQNAYDPHRLLVTVLDFSHAPKVNVDLKGLVPIGSSYVLRNAQDYFGSPAATGTYGGGPLEIAMSNLSAAPPLGWPAPKASPEIGAFILTFEPGQPENPDGGTTNPAPDAAVAASDAGTSPGDSPAPAGCACRASSSKPSLEGLIAIACVFSLRRRRSRRSPATCPSRS